MSPTTQFPASLCGEAGPHTLAWTTAVHGHPTMSNGLENVGRELVGEEEWDRAYTWGRPPPSRPNNPPEQPEDPPATRSPSPPPSPPSGGEEEAKNPPPPPQFLDHLVHLLPYWYFLSRSPSFPPQDLTHGEVNPAFIDALDAQRLNSLIFFESLKALQAQVSPGERSASADLSFSKADSGSSLLPNFQGVEKGQKRGPFGEMPLPTTLNLSSREDYDEDEPLDLTRKTSREVGLDEERQWSSTEVSSSRCLPEIPVTRPKAARPNQRSGRGYTTEELEAALRDIQSGKLGTRRAAVIYGIPRSTLRNKVYKLGKERGRKEEVGDGRKEVLKQWLQTKLARAEEAAKSEEEASSDNSDDSSRRDVILKIPSLVNNKSSLSRLISRKKLKRRNIQPPAFISRVGRSEASATATGEEFDDEKQRLIGEEGVGAGPSSASSNNSEGKKSRPKRGKYRNYDRDALLKAVRAVQNGEMSVHRAGSFYGVPHSTLEYKVKERHLLRRPKRKSPQRKSSPDSSLSGSEVRGVVGFLAPPSPADSDLLDLTKK